MTDKEYQIYYICEEFQKEIKSNFNISKTPIEMARFLIKKLSSLQMNQIIHDIYLIKKRGGNPINYYTLLIYPFLIEMKNK